MTKLLVRPSLHGEWPMPVRPVIQSMSVGLANLEHAAAGDLVGFALGHGLGARYIGGSVTEYECAFIGTGDGRSCDGTVIRLAPQAQSVLANLLPRNLVDGELARIFHWALGAPEDEFETVHFADFTVAMLYDQSPSEHDLREVRIFADPAQDTRDAERRAAEIGAIFAHLCEWHGFLRRYRCDLPTPDMLRRAT
ncbi:hypothetical protein [Marivita sp.]|uniref:hypothetical protein n=1 Tax=Marivita sp. TaxID=2003365 RepID=UPI0025BD3347|nr:hypothetical protein [Marivita sp.]